MTSPEKLEYLNQWQKCYEENENFYQKQKEIYELSPESLAASTIWDGFTAYTKCMSKLVGDTEEWLEWYCLENEMGKEQRLVGPKGKTKPIKNLSDLLELIEFNQPTK